MPNQHQHEALEKFILDLLEKYIRTVMDERDRRYEQRFSAQEEATRAAFRAADGALTKAETVMIRDKDQANEWREAMNDREKTFMPRAEYQAEHRALSDRITLLTGTRQSGFNAAWGYLLGVLGLAVAVAAVLLKH